MRTMGIIIGGIAVVVREVVARQDAPGEVGMSRVDAGVDHGYLDPAVAGGNVPGAIGVDLVQSILKGRQGIVDTAQRVAPVIGLGIGDVRVGGELLRQGGNVGTAS